VDRVSKFTEKDAGGNSTFDNLKNIGTGTNPRALGDVVSLLSVLKEIDTQKGTISLTGSAVIAMQIKHFAFGAFGSMEGFAKSDVDLVNVLPSSNGAAPVTTTQFANAAGSAPPSNAFFTDPTIRSGITSSLVGANFTTAQADNIVNAMDAQLALAGASGSKVPAISQSQAADIITSTIAPAFNLAGTNSIADNRTAVLTKSLAYIEFPISYGHPIDLGRFGKLGVGGSLKVVQGRVYNSQLNLVKNGQSVDSGKITDNLTKNFEESTSVTFDLGAFYKFQDWLNVGLVAKNLTSPKFDSPALKDQDGTLVTIDAKGNPVTNKGVTLKPQLRAGVSLDPLSWLTIAADLDLTDNETVLSSLDYKSRNLGGGVELHPVTWFKLRAGMYKNLSNSEVGPVATAGLTFGTKWVNLDLDGAYGLETAQYKEKSYPKEARVQTSLNIQF